MTPAGIKPAIFQFVAQHLNHCATMVPRINIESIKYLFETESWAEIQVDG